MRLVYAFLLAVLMLILSPEPIVAQDTPATSGTCPAIVERALKAVDNNCADLGRNSVCYGYSQVNALFSEAAEEVNFSVPSDTARIATLEQIETAPLDEDKNLWGLALMNVQANVPDTLPGQGVVFMLMGDARIENAVNADSVPEELAPPITVTTTIDKLRLRTLPDIRATVRNVIPLGAELTADVRGENGYWVRVIYDGMMGWVSREYLTSEHDLDSLTQVNHMRMSPMQAFRFTTGMGRPGCVEAQGALMVQGPNNVTVELEANGARIRVSSTVLLNSERGKLSVTTLSGDASVQGLVIPQGYTTEAPIDSNGRAGKFSRPMQVSADNLEYAKNFEKVKGKSLHYELKLPKTTQDIEEKSDKELTDFDFEDTYKDYDDDGVADTADNCSFVSNADQKDSDGDGQGDLCDADLKDDDGDGVPNGRDNCVNTANTQQLDGDGDGVGDVCDPDTRDTDNDNVPDARDNCPKTPNSDQADLDGDGVGNACDPDYIGVTPVADVDGDGVMDEKDNCPKVHNPDQQDSDGDGIGDACQSVATQEPDRDGDGVPDEKDNCPDVTNPRQLDSDGDGIGDLCDYATPTAVPPTDVPPTKEPEATPTPIPVKDSDGDGVPDERDNCPNTPNPEQRDSDGNGVGDACERPTEAPPTAEPTKEEVPPTREEPTPEPTKAPIVPTSEPPTAVPPTPVPPTDVPPEPTQVPMPTDEPTQAPMPQDSDGDGVPDESDNCPGVANPGQADDDGDGVGNACDDG